MYEHIGQMFLSVDLLGLGAFIPFLAITIGIGYLVSEGRALVIALTVGILNYIFAVYMFIQYQEGLYFILTTLAIIILVGLPDGWAENKFRQNKIQ